MISSVTLLSGVFVTGSSSSFFCIVEVVCLSNPARPFPSGSTVGVLVVEVLVVKVLCGSSYLRSFKDY